MTIVELENRIRELRNEAIVAAVSGDNAGALDAHNLAAELAQQRDAARHTEIVVSDK